LPDTFPFPIPLFYLSLGFHLCFLYTFRFFTEEDPGAMVLSTCFFWRTWPLPLAVFPPPPGRCGLFFIADCSARDCFETHRFILFFLPLIFASRRFFGFLSWSLIRIAFAFYLTFDPCLVAYLTPGSRRVCITTPFACFRLPSSLTFVVFSIPIVWSMTLFPFLFRLMFRGKCRR